jgi:hypothetical protein
MPTTRGVGDTDWASGGVLLPVTGPVCRERAPEFGEERAAILCRVGLDAGLRYDRDGGEEGLHRDGQRVLGFVLEALITVSFAGRCSATNA